MSEIKLLMETWRKYLEVGKSHEVISEGVFDFFKRGEEVEPVEEYIPPIPSKYVKGLRGGRVERSRSEVEYFYDYGRPTRRIPWPLPRKFRGRMSPADYMMDADVNLTFEKWLKTKHRPFIAEIEKSIAAGTISIESLRRLKNNVIRGWPSGNQDPFIKALLETALEVIELDFNRLEIQMGGHAGGLSLSDPEVGSLSLTGEVDPGSLSFT